jgi:outer membrane protein
MTKKYFSGLLTAAFILLASFNLSAQRVAIVDINQVLSALPEYKQAQEDLDRIAQRWRQEIAQEQDQIKSLYNRFQAESVLLTDEQKRQREDEITTKERSVREKQREKFGPEGELFKKRQELVKPVQDRVYSAIEKFSAEKGFDLILDKSSSAGVIFASPTLDKTQAIIDMLKK